MKTITITNACKKIANIVNMVRDTGDVYAIGRQGRPEVLVIKYPVEYSPEVSDNANVNTYSDSFLFLKDEPELYSVRDLKKRYV